MDGIAKLSLVIPTLNDGIYLERLLASLEAQTYQNFEVIVSDSSSTDDTAAIARKHGALLVQGEKRGPGFARNLGAKHATGDVLLFVDADVMLPEPTTLSKLIAAIEENPHVVGGTSAFYSYDGSRREKVAFSAASHCLEVMHKIGISSIAPGHFLFARADIFREINGFDESLPYCEDHDLASKIKRYGELMMIDSRIAVSSRRLQLKGFFNTIKEYAMPTFYYFFEVDEMKQRFIFTPASEIKYRKRPAFFVFKR